MHPAVVEERFRAGAERLRGWGAALLIIAGVLWCYAAYQMFTPYTSHYWKVDCDAPAFAERDDVYIDFARDDNDREKALRCAADRDWPQPVTALVLATPLSAVGAVLFTAGMVSIRLRNHDEDVARARG